MRSTSTSSQSAPYSKLAYNQLEDAEIDVYCMLRCRATADLTRVLAGAGTVLMSGIGRRQLRPTFP